MNPDESARVQFEKVKIAYEVLADDGKRSAYDKQHGFVSGQGGAAGSFTDYHSHKQRRRQSKIFSDDEDEEYFNLNKKRSWDKRTMPGQGRDWQRRQSE